MGAPIGRNIFSKDIRLVQVAWVFSDSAKSKKPLPMLKVGYREYTPAVQFTYLKMPKSLKITV